VPSIAQTLAEWAVALDPAPDDLELADRSLLDTLAVTVAAARDPVRSLARELPDAARWATLGHVLDFDDLHVESTAHVSVVCVPAVLVAGGIARAAALAVPAVGEHTDAILAELGLDEGQIARLRQAGTI
jgi:crotonobetainyl-CoA:carnitine CoA-transferase CaiB-like acyl-CoA transferase